ncbi:MAG: TIGR04219 family outer membrane beta-barrel protein [Thermodesulfovibrionales bacterium]|nr:TIGR04219 family outer membrane beta-barrel protein [Thermodesulfovibrionales bacterium]
MSRIIYSVIIVSLLIPAIAGAIGFEASIGAWNQDPEGYVSYKPVTSADRLDIEQDLNYDKETKVFGRLKIDMPLVIPNIYLMATPSRFDGRGQKDVSFKFGDKTFNANVPFDSEVQLDHYDIALYYGIPGLKTATLGILNIELGLNARIIDFYAEVKQPTTSISASKSATIPVPMVYAGIQVEPVDLLKIEGEFRGIAYSSNHYYDIIGRLKLNPFGPLFIAGGYRYEDVKIDYSDIEAEFKLKGPFLEAGIEF